MTEKEIERMFNYSDPYYWAEKAISFAIKFGFIAFVAYTCVKAQ